MISDENLSLYRAITGNLSLSKIPVECCFNNFRWFFEVFVAPSDKISVFSEEEAGSGTNNALSPRSEGVTGAAGALLNQKPTILSI